MAAGAVAVHAAPLSEGLLSLTMAALRLTVPWALPAPAPPQPQEPALRLITLDEVSWHDHAGDCWIILYDRVYDITNLLDKHPGGSDVLLEHAGRDATVAFRGAGHSAGGLAGLRPLGVLPPAECMYRCPGGLCPSDLPD